MSRNSIFEWKIVWYNNEKKNIFFYSGKTIFSAFP